LKVFLPTIGDAIPSSDFIVLPSSSIAPLSTIDFFVGFLLLLFVILLLDEGLECRGDVLNYLKSGWNLFEVVIFSLGLLWCVMMFVARSYGQQQIYSFHHSSNTSADYKILDLWSVGWLYSQAEFLVSISLMGTFIKFIKYIQWFPYIGPDIMALVKTLFSIRVLTFTIFVMFFIISLGIGVWIRFGSSALEFSSFGNSMISLFSIFTGNSFFESMIGGGPEQLLFHDNPSGTRTTGVLFYIIISFLVTLILANIFINVTGVVYEEAHENSLKDWSDSIDDEMITNTWLTTRGYPGNDRLSRILSLLQSWGRLLSCSSMNPFLKGLKSIGNRKKSTNWSVAKEVIQLETKLEALHAMESSPSFSPTHPSSSVARGRSSRKRRNSVMNFVGSDEDGKVDDGEQVLDEEIKQLLAGVVHTKELFWIVHETQRKRHEERKVKEEQIQQIQQQLHGIGGDVFTSDVNQLLSGEASGDWWRLEKKNPTGQILLLDDLQEAVVMEWLREREK
jgi:hypothetical protein